MYTFVWGKEKLKEKWHAKHLLRLEPDFIIVQNMEFSFISSETHTHTSRHTSIILVEGFNLWRTSVRNKRVFVVRKMWNSLWGFSGHDSVFGSVNALWKKKTNPKWNPSEVSFHLLSDHLQALICWTLHPECFLKVNVSLKHSWYSNDQCHVAGMQMMYIKEPRVKNLFDLKLEIKFNASAETPPRLNWILDGKSIHTQHESQRHGSTVRLNNFSSNKWSQVSFIDSLAMQTNFTWKGNEL